MKLFLVSNMYPDPRHPSYGIFVKRFCEQLNILNIQYKKSVMLKSDTQIGKLLRYMFFYSKTTIQLLIFNYDIVYVHYASHSAIPVLIAHKLRKKPVYTNVHGSDIVPENQQQLKMQKYTLALLKISQEIIVPSEYFKQYVMNKYALPAWLFHIYPSGGINPALFYPVSPDEKLQLRHKYSIAQDTLVFGMAGRISPGKGWDTFLKAIKKLKQTKATATYILVGNGNEEEKMNLLIDSLGIRDDVIRINLLPQEHLAEFYRVIDFLVFPSEREGESLGLVAIEAMACGTPVIASAFAALDYYIKDGHNGFKFETGNADALADCMKKCFKIYDTNTLEHLRTGAYNTAQYYFSDNIIDRLQELFFKEYKD